MDWNQYGEQDENDSWIENSDDENDKKQTSKQSQQAPETPENKEQVASKPEQEPELTVDKNTEEKKEERPKRTYPTDEEILKKLEDGEIEEDRKIKIVRYRDHELNQLKENKLISSLKSYTRKDKEGQIAYFNSKKQLMEFVKQKIEAKAMYKLQIYYPNPNKKNYQNKESYQKREGKNQQRKRNQEKNDYRKKNDHKYHNRKNNSREQEQRKKLERKDDRKKDNGSYHLKITEDDNHVRIINDKLPVEEAFDMISKRMNWNKYKKINILTTIKYLKYSYLICEEIQKKHKFFRSNKIDQKYYQSKEDQTFQLVLEEKVEATEEKPKKKYKQVKQRIINKNPEKYFENLEELNHSVIRNEENIEEDCEFNDKQYLSLFKDNYMRICKSFERWVIKAFQKNIPKALELYWNMKKSFQKQAITLEIGKEDQIPLLIITIENLDSDFPPERKKPDTSAVNSYLNA